MVTERPAPKWDFWPFRQWLQSELDEREWKPIDLARRMNPVAPVNVASSISKWMSGKRQPDSESCMRLAAILGADVESVMVLAGHFPAPTSIEDEAGEIRRAIRATVDRLPPDALRTMQTIVRALLDSETRGSTENKIARLAMGAAAVGVLYSGKELPW